MQIDSISLAERFHDEMFLLMLATSVSLDMLDPDTCIDGSMRTRLSMDALHCDCIAVRLHLWCSSP